MQEGFFIKEQTAKAIPEALKKEFSVEKAEKVQAFHRSFPMYSVTPLVHLSNAARMMGVSDVFIKDESKRFDLNAFKVLGGSYAIGKYLAERLGISEDDLTYEALTDKSVKEKLGEITFVTATDGNHGRGVAWAAKTLGFKSVVYMPKGSAEERLENIRKAGADASITDMNYDDCVRLSRKMAEEKGWVVVQDTAWEGYDRIPTWIMQGYGTMALEAVRDMPKASTHVFLQAGVGSMAASVASVLMDAYKDNPPKIVIVEPNKADCLYRSALAGERTFVTGDMDTIMAGLACGEPCTIAWEILKNAAGAFISCPDYAAAEGMRILAKPGAGDTPIVSGESGAAAFGCASAILCGYPKIKDALGIDKDSCLLFFSTEGATDIKNYRAIVEDGAYPGR